MSGYLVPTVVAEVMLKRAIDPRDIKSTKVWINDAGKRYITLQFVATADREEMTFDLDTGEERK